MMTEGQEREEFWNILGGKGEYSNSPRLQVHLPVIYYAVFAQMHVSYKITAVWFQLLNRFGF